MIMASILASISIIFISAKLKEQLRDLGVN